MCDQKDLPIPLAMTSTKSYPLHWLAMASIKLRRAPFQLLIHLSILQYLLRVIAGAGLYAVGGMRKATRVRE